LLQTILGSRLDIGLASLGQRNGLARFERRSKAGQGNNSRAQEAKYCQGRERFDHLRLLTVAVSRSRRARGSVHNCPSDEEFRKTQLLFEIGQMAWPTPVEGLAIIVDPRYLSRVIFHPLFNQR
jgi:hypothetical protein